MKFGGVLIVHVQMIKHIDALLLDCPRGACSVMNIMCGVHEFDMGANGLVWRIRAWIRLWDSWSSVCVRCGTCGMDSRYVHHLNRA